jgi:hypothetical protein
MKSQVGTIVSVLLIGLVGGGVMGCGVTGEVATTHPSRAASTAIEPSSEGASVNYPATEGRPHAPRLVASTAPMARVAGLPAAAAAPVADRSASVAAAEAKAVALGSPTRRIQSGRIVDEAGQPLVGATVLLKGTTRGASTDANGDYSLPVPLGTNTFIFAYSGYEQEIAQSRDGQPLLVTLLPSADRVVATPEAPSKSRARKKQQ